MQQRHRNVKEMAGHRFGYLTVTSFVDVWGRNARWRCLCDCGSEPIVFAQDLKSGRTKSCGCKKGGFIAAARRTHGGAPRGNHDPAYNCWRRARDRCYNEKNNRFRLYGARGIRVCDRWLYGDGGAPGFACFLADMGARPSASHSIDRINPDGDYEPSNCRWATPLEQARNKRRKARSA